MVKLLTNITSAIINGQRIKKKRILIDFNQKALAILEKLEQEGYIQGWKIILIDPKTGKEISLQGKNLKNTQERKERLLTKTQEKQGFFENQRYQAKIQIALKYKKGIGIIQSLKTVTKSSKRIYTKKNLLWKLSNDTKGLGTWILTTPYGVLTDREARQASVGGEVLLQVLLRSFKSQKNNSYKKFPKKQILVTNELHWK